MSFFLNIKLMGGGRKCVFYSLILLAILSVSVAIYINADTETMDLINSDQKGNFNVDLMNGLVLASGIILAGGPLIGLMSGGMTDGSDNVGFIFLICCIMAVGALAITMSALGIARTSGCHALVNNFNLGLLYVTVPLVCLFPAWACYSDFVDDNKPLSANARVYVDARAAYITALEVLEEDPKNTYKYNDAVEKHNELYKAQQQGKALTEDFYCRSDKYNKGVGGKDYKFETSTPAEQATIKNTNTSYGIYYQDLNEHTVGNYTLGSPKQQGFSPPDTPIQRLQIESSYGSCCSEPGLTFTEQSAV